ncbi:MAG TPA: ISL3 family transposase [Thermoplasmataceae archaeon]|nr:ISL3 family transposase [Thermoplasmataceae archaeon]
MPGVDEFSVEKHHVYVTLFYDIRNSRIIHIEEGKESEVFLRFLQKNPFIDPKGIEHVSMDMDPSFISGAEKYIPDSQIVFDHFHVIKMMNDALDRIRRKEAKENVILKGTRYTLFMNPDKLSEKQKEKLKDIRKLDLQVTHAYHFKESLQRLWSLRNEMVVDYLAKWISWARRSRMPEIIRLAKSMWRHMEGILEAIRSGISSGIVEGLKKQDPYRIQAVLWLQCPRI